MSAKKEKKASVSYKLLNKKRVLDSLELIINANNQKQFTNEFLNLLDMDSELVFSCALERLRSVTRAGSPGEITVVDRLLKVIAAADVDDNRIVEGVAEVARNQSISGEVKIILISFLAELGAGDDFFEGLIDLDEIDTLAGSALEGLVEAAKEGPEEQQMFVEEFTYYDEEIQDEILQYLIRDDSDGAIELLGCLAYSYDRALASKAVAALAKTMRARTLTVLQELAQYGQDSVKEIAQIELDRFLEIGHNKFSKRMWTSPIGELYDAVISSLDGQGNRTVWFAWRVSGKKTRLIWLGCLVNSQAGIKDCFGHFDITRNNFEKEIKNMAEDVALIRGDYNYALDLLRDGLFVNLEQGYPLPPIMTFWKRVLKDELYPKEFIPVNCIEGLEINYSPEQVQEIFEKSDSLLEYREFYSWFAVDEAVDEIARKVLEVSERHRGKPLLDEKFLQLENKLINKVIKPALPELTKRLLYTADFLMRSGNEDLAKETLICFDSLTKVPPEKHPFVRGMCVSSIQAAIKAMFMEDSDEIPF